MSENFGARLRQRREAQGIALETIARNTKIKLSLLEALEHDDVSQLPSGFFRRAFVRAYAQAVGLDPDGAVRELLAAHPEPANGTGLTRVFASNGHAAPSSGGPPTRLHTMMDSAIESLSRRRQSTAANDEGTRDAPIQASTPIQPDAPAAEPPQPEPEHIEPTPEPEAVAVPTTVSAPAPYEPDLLAIADLCTAFGRVESADEFPPLLEEAARILDTRGLIVWLWDEMGGELRPALVHGYPEQILARLPAVTRDSDNATAEAFRSAQMCIVDGDDHSGAALVVPLLTPVGCTGALALEFEPEVERDSKKITSIRAMATIFAALLAQLVGGQSAASQDISDGRSRESA